MRVALLVTDLQRGGAPLRIASYARGLRALGVDVYVGCLAPRGPVSDDLERLGIPTFACDARSPRDLLALRRLSARLTAIRPDLLHATLTHANLAARLVARHLGHAVLTSTATIEVQRRWHLWLERLTAARDDGHIVNSRTLAEHVQRRFGRSPQRIFIIPPTLDPPKLIDRPAARALFALSDDHLAIAWLGRFDPVKRLDLLLDAVARLGDPRVRLLLAGDGPTRSEIQRRAEKLGLRDSVRLLGWQPDTGPLLSAADLFALPSQTEGMPNAVLQAMYAGLPVIASDIAAHRELSGPDRRIELFGCDIGDPRRAISASDSSTVRETGGSGPVAALAAAIRSLLDNPPRRRALGQRAAAWARSLGDERSVAAELLAVYERVQRRRDGP